MEIMAEDVRDANGQRVYNVVYRPSAWLARGRNRSCSTLTPHQFSLTGLISFFNSVMFVSRYQTVCICYLSSKHTTTCILRFLLNPLWWKSTDVARIVFLVSDITWSHCLPCLRHYMHSYILSHVLYTSTESTSLSTSRTIFHNCPGSCLPSSSQNWRHKANTNIPACVMRQNSLWTTFPSCSISIANCCSSSLCCSNSAAAPLMVLPLYTDL